MARRRTLSHDPFEGTAYQALERIGAGGMGEVFVVEHRHIGRKFVAKVLHAEFVGRSEVVDRLRLEAQVLGRLSHPNIVSVMSFGTTRDGRPFLVMEYLQGRTLGAKLRESGAFPVERAVWHTVELLHALGAAHSLGVVHRDVKPENLFLVQSPSADPTLKILDFGIVRLLPDAPPGAPRPLSMPTGTGAIIGTPRFLSPEGARGERVDTRADLYGAALVLYSMLAGRGPFDHAVTERALVAAHSGEEPAPPSRHAREPVPAELDRIVLKGLRKDADQRFQCAEEFLAELERVLTLLKRPASWMQTTAFEPGAVAQSEPAALPSARLMRKATPDKAPRPFDAHALTDAIHVDRMRAMQVARRIPPRSLVIVFIAGVTLTTILTLALLELVGAPR